MVLNDGGYLLQPESERMPSECNLECMVVHIFVDIEARKGIECVMHCEGSRNEPAGLVNGN